MECRLCHAPLPDAERTRKRGRQCGDCKRAAILKRRHEDPVAKLTHRWYNAARRLWPHAPRTLWSRATVQHVYTRCRGMSVLSEEDNVGALCVSYTRRDGHSPPALEELVLLTTREAQSLARMPKEQRPLKFARTIGARNGFPQAPKEK
jgi:hypothetical protein